MMVSAAAATAMRLYCKVHRLSGDWLVVDDCTQLTESNLTQSVCI